MVKRYGFRKADERTNFHALCDAITKLDDKIAAALVIRNEKLLATSIGSGAPLLTDEYLSKLLIHAQIMVGIPLTNKPVFGDFNFTLVSHEKLENILFHLENDDAILGVGILPPFNRDELLAKIQNFLKHYSDNAQMDEEGGRSDQELAA